MDKWVNRIVAFLVVWMAAGAAVLIIAITTRLGPSLLGSSWSRFAELALYVWVGPVAIAVAVVLVRQWMEA